jgi:hypothetical protein
MSEYREKRAREKIGGRREKKRRVEKSEEPAVAQPRPPSTIKSSIHPFVSLPLGGGRESRVVVSTAAEQVREREREEGGGGWR